MKLHLDKDVMRIYIKMSFTNAVWDYINKTNADANLPKKIIRIISKPDEDWRWKDLVAVCMHFGITPVIEMRGIDDEKARLCGLVEA